MNPKAKAIKLALKHLTGQSLRRAQWVLAKYQQQYVLIAKGIGFNINLVEGGELQMGSNNWSIAMPIHTQKLPTYYMAEFEVTKSLYRLIAGHKDYDNANDGNLPIENISWVAAQNYIRALNTDILPRNTHLPKGKFVLPAEAQWEYAAQGGNMSQGYQYAGGNKIEDVAWSGNDSIMKIRTVGKKQPNELGLYDMSGNVWEWCRDKWQPTYDSTEISVSERAIRGGSFQAPEEYCHIRFRNGSSSAEDFIGFRVAYELYAEDGGQ